MARRSKPHWSAANYRIESYNVRHLLPHFGRLLLSDIDSAHVSRYQTRRTKEQASPKTINNESRQSAGHPSQTSALGKPPAGREALRTHSEIGRPYLGMKSPRYWKPASDPAPGRCIPPWSLPCQLDWRNAELRNLRWRNIDLLKAN